MLVKKIILRTLSGTPVCSATLRKDGDALTLSLPSGITLLAALENGEKANFSLAEQGLYLFSSSPSPLSFFARKGEETLCASENTRITPFEIWKLNSLAEEEIKTKEDPSEEKISISSEISELSEKSEEPTITLPSEDESTQEKEDPLPEETSLSPLNNEDKKQAKLQKIKDFMAKGEPFPRFESYIEGSKWVRMPEEDYLLGVLEEKDDTIVFYGVPGKLGEAPDDNCEWAFLPAVEESEDWGYYICKSKDFD